MPQDAVPDPSAPDPGPRPEPEAPTSLLQQMEEMMAALNADLSQLDADLQSSAGYPTTAGDGDGDGEGDGVGAGDAEHSERAEVPEPAEPAEPAAPAAPAGTEPGIESANSRSH